MPPPTDIPPEGPATASSYHTRPLGLADNERSALQRYRTLVLGRPGIGPMLRHEFITLLAGGWPGALGLLLRKLLFPVLVGRCGKNVVWGRNVVIRHGHKISIGDNVIVDDYVVLDAKGNDNRGIVIEDDVLLSRDTILSCKNGNIHLGREVSFGIHSLVHAVEGSDVTVGDKSVIAAYVYLIGGGNYKLDRLDLPIKEQGTYAKGGIHIAKNVWIGAKAQLLDGVHIGGGSVVAAGAVVQQDFPENVIVAGVPARVIRQRQAPGALPPDAAAAP